MKHLRRHLSFANVISMVALAVALGGTSYAAIALPRNSVGSKQIKGNAVRSADVKDRSLRAVDFAANDLPRGATGGQGPAGPRGEDGAPGTGRAFARVASNGDIVAFEGTGGAPQARNITNDMIVHTAGSPVAENPSTPAQEETTGTGVYCFGGLGFTPTSAVVSTDNTDSMPDFPSLTVNNRTNFISTVAINKGPELGRCPPQHEQVRVAITQVNDATVPSLADHGFFIWLEG